MKLLGLDYGEKKIGIAISDEKQKFAFPYCVLDNLRTAEVIRKIKNICAENQIGQIIIGQSLDFQGKPNPIMKRIENFKKKLEKNLKIAIKYENEVLTTQQAKRVFSRRPRIASSPPRVIDVDDKIHASAAALILQSYLDKLTSKYLDKFTSKTYSH